VTLRHTATFTLTLLAIEFLDEFVFGARGAAWPLNRTDLGLSYAQIGLLLGLPSLVSSLVEPFLGILGDIGRRRVLILGGGVVFALALLLTALSRDFLILLLSFVLLYPASGAFVTASQAMLMDTDSTRHEQNMARWTLAGSVGVVAGPIALGVAATLGLGWRWLFLLFAGLKTHDVGTITADERVGPAYDTPSLRGLYDSAPYLHDGSAATLYDVLTTRNPSDQHGITSHLTEQ